MRKLLWFLAAAALTHGLGHVGARAQSKPSSYALIIGSNRGGSGQGTLSFAQRDAQRMAALLAELGRTPREHITLLNDPSAAEVAGSLEALEERIRAHTVKGERAQVLFYYSGHARAHALSLGDEELSLSALRSSLLALPSTLTVVVLDACQSGAFSGVKGASPAADFSVSSVENLHSSGIAVMASSTASELSQESSALGSSYFTHHLLTALRGVGDLDRNGRVSLDEAYHYAYERTLSDTARTQVGSQHATLETELTGRGDVPLTYPVDADAQLALPPPLTGSILVQRAQRGAVVAELVKAAGSELLLALPSGAYEVLVRSGGRAKSCDIALTKGSVHTLRIEGCRDVALPAHASKQPRELPPEPEKQPPDARPPESWFLEFGIAPLMPKNDAYIKTLRTFDYQEDEDGLYLGFDAAAGIGVHRYLQLVARGFRLETRAFSRATERGAHYGWTTHAFTVGPRLRLPLARHWLVLFGDVTAGMGFARTQLEDSSRADAPKTHSERHQNFVLRAQGGITVGFTRHFGAYFAASYSRAPVLLNRLDQLHDSGGFTFTHGLRLNAVKGWW